MTIRNLPKRTDWASLQSVTHAQRIPSREVHYHPSHGGLVVKARARLEAESELGPFSTVLMEAKACKLKKKLKRENGDGVEAFKAD